MHPKENTATSHEHTHNEKNKNGTCHQSFVNTWTDRAIPFFVGKTTSEKGTLLANNVIHTKTKEVTTNQMKFILFLFKIYLIKSILKKTEISILGNLFSIR